MRPASHATTRYSGISIHVHAGADSISALAMPPASDRTPTIIASSIGQVEDLLPHRERGYLCPPGNPEELAKAMAHLIRNQEEAQRIGQEGRRWVLSHATWSKRVGEILNRVEALS